MGTGVWGSPSYGPALETPPALHGVPDMGTGAWPSPPYSPPVGTPPELHGALVSSWLPLPHCAGAGTPPDPPSDPILDAGLMLPEAADAGTATQVSARPRGWGKHGWALAGGWHGTGHSLSGGLGAPLRQCGAGVGVAAAWSGIGNGARVPFPLQRVHVGRSVLSPGPVLPSATLPVSFGVPPAGTDLGPGSCRSLSGALLAAGLCQPLSPLPRHPSPALLVPISPTLSPRRTSPQISSLSWRLCCRRSPRTDRGKPQLLGAGATQHLDACDLGGSGDACPPLDSWEVGGTRRLVSPDPCWLCQAGCDCT